MFHTPKIVVCCKQQKRLCHKCVSIDMRVSCNYKNFTVLLCVRFCFLSCVGWNHSHHHQQQLVLWLNLMVLIIMSYLRQNMTPLSIHTFGTDTHTHTHTVCHRQNEFYPQHEYDLVWVFERQETIRSTTDKLLCNRFSFFFHSFFLGRFSLSLSPLWWW